MRNALYGGIVTFAVALAPVSQGLAQNCQSYWTEAYKRAQGCLGGGGSYQAPAYQAPVVRQPSQGELLERQATALNNQGVSLHNRGQFREAMRLFELSLKVRPSAKAQENLGNSYSQIGVEYFNRKNYQEAVRYFESARHNNPGNAQIAKNLAAARSELESRQREARQQADLDQAKRNIVGTVLSSPIAGPSNTAATPASTPAAGGLDFMAAGGQAPVASAPISQSEARAAGGGSNNSANKSAAGSGLEFAAPGASPSGKSAAAACSGAFCTPGNPADPQIGAAMPPQVQTTYKSASAQADAAKNGAGCVFDGGPNACPSGTPIIVNKPEQHSRGAASLPIKVLEAMNKTPEGRQLMEQEMALQVQLAGASSKVDDIKKKKDAAIDPAERKRLEVDYSNADNDKSKITQQLYVAKDKVETQAKKYVLDDDVKK